MTLNDLIRKASEMSRQLSTGDVPLILDEFPVENIEFEFCTFDIGKINIGEDYVRITIK